MMHFCNINIITIPPPAPQYQGIISVIFLDKLGKIKDQMDRMYNTHGRMRNKYMNINFLLQNLKE